LDEAGHNAGMMTKGRLHTPAGLWRCGDQKKTLTLLRAQVGDYLTIWRFAVAYAVATHVEFPENLTSLN
jgi:hypothetical protein